MIGDDERPAAAAHGRPRIRIPAEGVTRLVDVEKESAGRKIVEFEPATFVRQRGQQITLAENADPSPRHRGATLRVQHAAFDAAGAGLLRRQAVARLQRLNLGCADTGREDDEEQTEVAQHSKATPATSHR